MMYDRTDSAFYFLDKIELPPKMTNKFIKKLRRKHPQPLAINDSATYEYQPVRSNPT